MPEGDTILRSAHRLSAALVGKRILSLETPQPHHAFDRLSERLSGRAVRAVDAHGKHLFVRFEGDLTLHSHLRMGGSWKVFAPGERWSRSPRRAWLVIRTDEHAVVQFDGPVLELTTQARRRFDQRLAALGPDILAPELDEPGFLRRLRDDDPTRAIGAALLDQRNIAGIGNIWKSEGCFIARVSPWRALAEVDDDAALAIVRAARPLMLASATRDERIGDRRPSRPPRRPGESGRWVYKRAGLPCRACATIILARGQGDDNRTTYWCPACQR